MIIVICLFMEKKIFNFNANYGDINFATQFCLGSISNGFGDTGSRDVSSKEISTNF